MPEMTNMDTQKMFLEISHEFSIVLLENTKEALLCGNEKSWARVTMW